MGISRTAANDENKGVHVSCREATPIALSFPEPRGQHYDLPVDHGEGGRGGIPVPQFSPRCVLLCDLAVTLVGYLAIRGATLEAVVGCSDALLSPPLLQYAPNAPSSRDLEVRRDVG